MKKANLRNPNVLDGSNITTAGRQVFGLRKGDNGKFTDFGVIESIEPNREETKRTLKGNRNGRTKTFKEVIDESTFSITFQTSATGDVAVREWYLGTRGIVTGVDTEPFAATTALDLGDLIEAAGRVYRVAEAGTTGSAAPAWPSEAGLTVVSGDVTFVDVGTVEDNAIRAYSNDATIGEGAFIVVLSTEESGGTRTIIRAFPNGSIQGNGEPTIQDFDGYQFLMTAVTNLGWAPPVALGNFATARPDGVIYDVPNSRVDEVLDTLVASLAAYVDAA